MKSFTEVLEILNALANEPSTTEKINLLKEFSAHGLFRLVLKAALEDHRNYHMTKLSEVPISNVRENTNDIFQYLTYLAEKTGATDADKIDIAHLASANPSCREVVSRIIKKDLRCGVSAKSVNKAIPGLLATWSYMRCQSFTEKNMERITYPAQIEKKADGTHVDIILRGGKVRFASRKGRNMNFFNELDNYFLNLDAKGDLVFIGEAVVLDENNYILDRKTGNGIINKAIKGTITRGEAKGVVLTLWDVVPYHDFMNGLCTLPHHIRFKKLEALFPSPSVFVQIIPHKTVSNKAGALEFFKEIRQGGGEGAIIKNATGIFKNYTSPDQVKLKAEFNAEFEVIDWASGKPGTKYANHLGAIQVSSSDGKVVSWCGSGFSDEERKGDLKNEITGRIVTIRFESLIRRKATNKGADTISLYLPRFIEVRYDKDTADDYKYLSELSEGV